MLEWTPPFAKWFVGGKINLATTAWTGTLSGAARNKAAIIWEGEPGEQCSGSPTSKLHDEV